MKKSEIFFEVKGTLKILDVQWKPRSSRKFREILYTLVVLSRKESCVSYGNAWEFLGCLGVLGMKKAFFSK